MKNIHSLALSLVLALPLAVNAAEHSHTNHGAMNHENMSGTMDMGKSSQMSMAQNDQAASDMPETAASSMSQGVIRKVDKSGKKITIKHGPLVNLDMPGMTMVFKVKDTTMLDQVKVGDKVNFVAETINGALTVTKIEVEK